MPDIVSVRTGKVVEVPFSISGWREYHASSSRSK